MPNLETELPSATRTTGIQLLEAARSLALEKHLDPEEILQGIESGLVAASRKTYGKEPLLQAKIHRENGEIHIFREFLVVETPQAGNTQIEISLQEAQKENPEIRENEIHKIPLPLPSGDELLRNGLAAGRDTLREIVHAHQNEARAKNFQGREGTLLTGEILHTAGKYSVVSTPLGDVMLPVSQKLPGETLRSGQHIKVIITEIALGDGFQNTKIPENNTSKTVQSVRNERNPGTCRVMSSRRDPRFLLEVLKEEIPDIREGNVLVKSIARDPGNRAKIAISMAGNSTLTGDPIGAVIGMRGSRIQAVVHEMGGERIDVLLWSGDAEAFIADALKPAQVDQVLLDPPTRTATVLVPEGSEDRRKALGVRGVNVRLASKLTGWNLEILDQNEFSEMESQRRQKVTEALEAVSCTESEALLLDPHGFRSPQEIAETEPKDFPEIPGISAERLQEIHARSVEFTERDFQERTESLQKAGITQDLLDFLLEANLPIGIVEQIVRKHTDPENTRDLAVVRTLQDFADLDTQELLGEVVHTPQGRKIVPGLLTGIMDLSEDDAGDLILNARVALGQFSEEVIEEIFGEDPK